MSSQALHLQAGDWELDLEPARGAAVTSLRYAGRDVLVTSNAASSDAMGSANFALVPYANRIAKGRFSFRGRDYTVPPNLQGHPHPLHGTGWKRPWTVTELKPDAIELTLVHSPDEHWPWAYAAVQRIELKANEVRFDIKATNTATEAAPFGLGFHPAFAVCDATRLHTVLKNVWQIDDEIVPVALAPANTVLPELPEAPAAARSVLVDHCFPEWPLWLDIRNAGHDGSLQLEMRASEGMTFFHFYSPPGKGYICAEPVSQMPDALHHLDSRQDTGLCILAPGESLQGWMTIGAQLA